MLSLPQHRTVPMFLQTALSAAVAEAQSLIEHLSKVFDEQVFRPDTGAPEDLPLDRVASWANKKREGLPQLEEWIDYIQVMGQMKAAGLEEFIDGLSRARYDPTQWADIFLRQTYTLWLSSWYERKPALARFRSVPHEAAIEEFRQLDQWQWQVASHRIAERLVQRRPTVSINQHRRSEPAILLYEASKRKRFRPLRKLFKDLPNLLPALKPCMLMSPVSVAQFLGESAMEFDVVVFDEASQILPADAIGSICRAKQVVVVGDQKQLPPTRFFNVTAQIGDDDDDEDELPESILDSLIAASLPSKRLRWHYRSRHEHLIAFSNKHFYDNSLITFPSANANEKAVEFIHVEDGVYDRAGGRYNRVEAGRVVDLIIDHARQNPSQSLGVIAFSEAQMTAIQTELDMRKRAQPDLEPLLREDGAEGFFVKNLERVQGDERDVIIFSVGYGRDHAGNMTMNFGPLNREGGERRLNVAVTRARDHVKIVASFYPYDIDRSRTKAKGVHLLRSYLEFADQGPIALLGGVTSENGDFESPFEESVANALTAQGLRIVSQVGVGGFRIDLGIKDEETDRYLLGIECDGAAYHSSQTARDRDRLRQQVLENLGWQIHRIWSTDWIKNPDRETAKVLTSLEQARTVSIDAVHEDESATSVQSAVAEAEQPPVIIESMAPMQILPQRPAIARTYVSASLSWQGNIDDFRGAWNSSLARLVEECVNQEGPVHKDRVMRVVTESYGISRIGSQVRARIREAIRYAVQYQYVTMRGNYLWPKHLAETPVRSGDLSGHVRDIKEVPPEEIQACIVALVDSNFSMPRDYLIAGVARELGYERTGNHVATAIGEVLDRALAGGLFIDTGGQVRLADEMRNTHPHEN